MTDETPKTYKTLESLVDENLEDIKEGKRRPYKVTPSEGNTVYALSNSSGNAALALCEVETCSQKQIKVALLNALANKAKEAKP
jgi:Ser/Thr protein kinase RdoA (MazF antagonist)